MVHRTFLGILKEFAQVSNEIIEKLNEEIVWMKGHHKRCIAAKTVDTTMSVAGTAVFIGAVITAPFTGNKFYKINVKRFYIIMLLNS